MSKTTFILGGGNDRRSKSYGHHLSQELAKHITHPKILSCFFSWPENTWEEKARVWGDWFSNNFPQPFTYDYAKRDTLLEQIDAADVIYFHGGNTQLLFKNLPDVEELKRHFKGKIIVGNSSGANMLSRYFWSSKRGVFGEGKNILDLSIMVHYGAPDVDGRKRTIEDWRQEEAKFQKQIGSQKIIRIPEEQFIVIEQP